MDLDALFEGLDRNSEISEKFGLLILKIQDDKELLKQIIIHPNSPNKLRKLAIANVSDDQFLFDQAIKSYPTYGDPPEYYGIEVLTTSIKRVAVRQIRSEILLKKIVMKRHIDGAVTTIDLKKITDQDFHKTIVKASISIAHIKTAIWQIKDKEFLQDLINSPHRTDLTNSLQERLRFLNRD